MEEEARNAQWEDLNAPDPFEAELMKSATALHITLCNLNNAEKWMYDAISDLADTPMADKVQSLVEEMLSLHSEIERLAEKYGRGQRE
jgi:hypothetical protein